MTTTTFDEGAIRAHTLIVSAKVDGTFRRAGRTFTRESVDIPLEELSDDELEALLKEPLLYTAFVGDAANAPPQETETHANPSTALENPPPLPPAQAAASAAVTVTGDGMDAATGMADEVGQTSDTGATSEGEAPVTDAAVPTDGDAGTTTAAAGDTVQPPVNDPDQGTVPDQTNTPESDPLTGAAHESAAPADGKPKRNSRTQAKSTDKAKK